MPSIKDLLNTFCYHTASYQHTFTTQSVLSKPNMLAGWFSIDCVHYQKYSASLATFNLAVLRHFESNCFLHGCRLKCLTSCDTLHIVGASTKHHSSQTILVPSTYQPFYFQCKMVQLEVWLLLYLPTTAAAVSDCVSLLMLLYPFPSLWKLSICFLSCWGTCLLWSCVAGQNRESCGVHEVCSNWTSVAVVKGKLTFGELMFYFGACMSMYTIRPVYV